MSDLPLRPEPCVPQLLEAMRAVGSGLGPDATLERICATATALVDAGHVAIRVFAEDGAGFTDLVHHGGDEESAWRAEPIRVHGEVVGNLYLGAKRGGGPYTEHDLTLVRVLATEAGIAIGNARLYEAARQRERWIDGSVAVTTALLSGGDIGASLRIVAEQARRLSGAAAGIVLLPADAGGLEIVAVDAESPSDALGVIIPPESEIVAELLDGEPVFVADAATDPRLAIGTGLGSDYGPTMLLPLQSDGRVVGSLAMPRARGESAFTETERALAVQFAAQAALALMMAEAQRDRERLAVYEDRDRIARDLHDLVIQRLFATGMMLESAQRGPVAPEVRDGVGRAVDELDVTIQEIRTAIFALQDDPGEIPSELSTRVEREIHMAAVALGFQPSLRVVGPVDTDVGELTGKNLVAALREGLSNAFRHAGASRIDVVVDADATLPDGRRGVRLTVADDGVGIPEGGRRSGLRNLKRRAESLGGDSVHGPGSGPAGGGTTVVWQAPY
ncbi:GAF domain-containing protein [Streptomyces turgidiscabies]|uniref:GAF domain protein n=1 Tax=Streptomyces turgidiscabies (strain Car8) TaxID=698760 RepID=L7EUH6_STRT8|nr:MULTISPECIES: GAF domain-containing protein [Streptomyces]ELP62529.1 GAF domain protein [Streptomyces turgidiscabies Car8]MDX3499634.1 GAF domain-containing protein [Streptomyces turgidiscabies]GAQ69620.1 redox sensor histidine kinase response regulator [Streptomyces turgidiscabies]